MAMETLRPRVSAVPPGYPPWWVQTVHVDGKVRGMHRASNAPRHPRHRRARKRCSTPRAGGGAPASARGKSWALVTFETLPAAEAAIADTRLQLEHRLYAEFVDTSKSAQSDGTMADKLAAHLRRLSHGTDDKASIIARTLFVSNVSGQDDGSIVRLFEQFGKVDGVTVRRLYGRNMTRTTSDRTISGRDREAGGMKAMDFAILRTVYAHQDLDEAACIIQAHVRGRLDRRRADLLKDMMEQIQQKHAARKIQTAYRGRLARRAAAKQRMLLTVMQDLSKQRMRRLLWRCFAALGGPGSLHRYAHLRSRQLQAARRARYAQVNAMRHAKLIQNRQQRQSQELYRQHMRATQRQDEAQKAKTKQMAAQRRFSKRVRLQKAEKRTAIQAWRSDEAEKQRERHDGITASSMQQKQRREEQKRASSPNSARVRSPRDEGAWYDDSIGWRLQLRPEDRSCGQGPDSGSLQAHNGSRGDHRNGDGGSGAVAESCQKPQWRNSLTLVAPSKLAKLPPSIFNV